MSKLEDLITEYDNAAVLGAGRTRAVVLADIAALPQLPPEPTIAALDAIAGESYRELTPTRQAATVATYVRLLGAL